MIFPLLQIAVVALVALYFGRWRLDVRRRSTQSWESLLLRLRPDWSARELSDQFLWKEGLNATPEDTFPAPGPRPHAPSRPCGNSAPTAPGGTAQSRR